MSLASFTLLKQLEAEQVKKALEILQDFGWVKIEEVKTQGRPLTKVRIHPQNALEARLVTQSAVLFAQGMRYSKKAGEADMLCQSQFYSSYGAKLIRLHNETIDTLNRYRRGGEQRVFVQHNVVADKAVVNNFTGVGVSTSSKGESPCPHENAAQKPEPITTSPVDSPLWPMADAGSMGVKA